jgi:hypothetical protein
MQTIKESKTKVYKHFSIGWTGETITTVNGQTYEISTSKRRGGLISSSARKVEAAGEGGTKIISFSPFQDKAIQLGQIKARTTEKAVRELHFKSIAIFDEKVKDGEIQPIEKRDPQKFDIIFLDGYGKSKGSAENSHVIYEIENKGFGISYKTVEIDTLKLSIQDHVKPYAEKFGIGMYWEEGFKFKGSEEALNNMILDSFEAKKIREAKQEEEAKTKREDEKQACEQLIKEYKHLTPIREEYSDKEAKSNLVADLKHNFPKVKFSVRKRGYNSYVADWINGPTVSEVEKITNNYQSHSFDETGDYLDYNPDNFNKTFGGFKFLFVGRELSEEIEALRDEFNERFDFDSHGNKDYFYKFMQKQTIPQDAKIKSIERKEDFCGSMEDAYFLTFEEQENPEAVEIGEVQIIEYSEKAIAVIGETKPIKDLLKKLGGRFNFRLKCGAGWIFPISRAEEVKEALSL